MVFSFFPNCKIVVYELLGGLLGFRPGAPVILFRVAKRNDVRIATLFAVPRLLGKAEATRHRQTNANAPEPTLRRVSAYMEEMPPCPGERSSPIIAG